MSLTKGRQLKAYLKSGIQGQKGADGLQGEQGLAGQDGKSAYQIALENGFVGTESDWLLTLTGDTGEQGLLGLQGIQGEQGIKGDKGDTGDSGVVFAEFPLEYNSETKTISIASSYSIPSVNDISVWNDYGIQIGDISSALDAINGESV